MRRNQSNQTTKRKRPDSLNQGMSNVMNLFMTTGHRTICSPGDTHVQQGRGENSGCRTPQKRTRSKPPFSSGPRGLLDFWPWPRGPQTIDSPRTSARPCRISSTGTNQIGICCFLLVSSNCKDGPVNVRCAFEWGAVAMQWTNQNCPLPIAHRNVATRQPQFPICVPSRAFGTAKSMCPHQHVDGDSDSTF